MLLQQWNGNHFEKISLKSLGLRVQLGHVPGSSCFAPRPGNKDFVVIHTNGIHSVAVDFCECENAENAGSLRQQVLRRSWYPSTHLEPQTCFTFRVLEHFHMQTLQGKVAMYDYYLALEKLTDNTGLYPCKVCLPSNRGLF